MSTKIPFVPSKREQTSVKKRWKSFSSWPFFYKCLSEGTKSSRSEVIKVKNRQESIKSTSGVALVPGLHILHTHTQLD